MTEAQRAFLERIAARTDITYTCVKGAGDSRVAKALEAAGYVKRTGGGLFAWITDAGRAALVE